MSGQSFLGGKYRVLRELGVGGSANVYLALAQGLGGFNKLVVLKVLKRELCADRDFRAMFLNEARLSARLNHPNVVQVNEVVSDAGAPVIIMEYLEGASLNELRKKAGSALSRDAEIRVIAESLTGLHYSHELRDYDGTPFGVVHRDMTPHNLFVTFDGQVKVLDFGIAKLNNSAVETQVGVIKGKIRYMPPEQIAGERVDRRVDVFAVGVMLWEAICGRRLWQDLSEAAVINSILRGEIPSPREFDPDVPDELEDIVMKALEYEREDRYASADELREALEGYLATRPVVALRDIARLAAEVFAEERAAARRDMDERLKAASFGAFPVHDAELDSDGRISTATTMVTDRVVPEVSPLPVRAARKALWPVALSAALAMVTLSGVGDGRGGESAAEASAAFNLPVAALGPVVTEDHAQGAHQPPVHPKVVLSEPEAAAAKAPPPPPLTKSQKRAAAPSVVRRAAAKAPVAAAKPVPPAPAAAKPNCSPPYYIDGKGLKRYRIECL